MKAISEKSSSDGGKFKRDRRWDLAGLFLGLLIATFLVFLFDTGSLAEWIARHKETKLDEAIVVSVIFLIGLSFFSVRKWLGLSQRLIKYEDSKEHADLPDAARIKKTQRRDLMGLFVALVIAVALVFIFDTGSLAEWVAKHKDTKIDEVIVASVILLIGVSFFAIRRWLELSDQVIKYEELYTETVRLSRESTLLAEFSDLLQSCLSPEEAHQLIASRAQMLFPGTSGALCVTANSRDLVEVVATWGQPSLADRTFPPKDCWALRRGKVHVFEDEPGALSCAHLGRLHPRGAVCMPMMAHGEALGLLYLDTGLNEGAQIDLSPAQLFESQQKLAKTFAEQAALALANLNMREILRAQSIRDPLTGLYNRRYMQESLERELSRATRKKSTVGLMMLDVDHFKHFNDTFGHEAGDTVLRTLGSILKTQFRGEDVACRYGGEEFTVILPEASIESTHQRAEQLCERVRKEIAELHDQPIAPVSLSIGVSIFPTDGASGETLLRAADAALYQAKAQGRDRVVIA